MRRALVFLILPALTLTACVSFSTRTPERIDAPLTDVFRQARNGNWRVRVQADSVYAGRVSFVQRDDAARIGAHVVRFDRITRVERWYESDLGGKRTGAIIGGVAGIGLGYLGVQFWEYGFERPCDGICQLKHYVPSIAFLGLTGALVGAGLDPPTRNWATIWQR